MKDANRKYHDRVAARYDEVYDTEYWRCYRELSWRHLRRYLPSQRPALAADLGCGTGWFGLRLWKAGLDTVFLDPSGNMLTAARTAAQGLGERGPSTRYVQAGLEDMGELDDESLDFATAQGDPLSFCADPLRALRELRRCLRPGAVAVLSVDSRVGGVRSLLEAEHAEAALELLRDGKTQWRGHRADERFAMRMFDPDELDTMLARTGFTPLSRIAKTCLLQRRDEQHLADPRLRRRLLQAEEQVHALPQWFALAAHFQVAARRD